MSKILTVFGATGTQGGSVIRAILAHPTLSQVFKIRGITRDASKPAAQSLIDQGIEVKEADLTSKESLTKALRGSHTVFLVTSPDFMAKQADQELQQGRNVADVSETEGVQHLIFSSLVHVTKSTNGRLAHVKHFDYKAETEEYIRSKNIPSTFVLPGYFMTNYIGLKLLQKGEDGTDNLSYPTSSQAKFPLIDASSDMGLVFDNALNGTGSRLTDIVTSLLGKQILAAAKYYTPTEIVSEFTNITDKEARFIPVDAETYKKFLPAVMADELLENHLLIDEPGYFLGQRLDESHKLLAGEGFTSTSWAEFLEQNKASFD
ncbi:family transcriptional regulator [Fusarium albosuccineum]|uniref:Family transcriptional regulator n=1 Tax=Fusarium albosuccineum TaxID=1237068 RepID=A0A8H4LFJ0_9HYPO|nr:family transcriptional regulator [Fusarium albosuccineum]